MYDSLFFATFDPVYVNAPDICDQCIKQPPTFTYEYFIEEEGGQRQYIKGYCCAACAEVLLKKLKTREAQEWAEEEAELEADAVDVTDFLSFRATSGSPASRVSASWGGRGININPLPPAT